MNDLENQQVFIESDSENPDISGHRVIKIKESKTEINFQELMLESMRVKEPNDH